jgi:hypothetical protein
MTKLDELATFSNSAHDDLVDSTTQALNHLRTRFSGAGPVRLREQALGQAEPCPASVGRAAAVRAPRAARFSDLPGLRRSANRRSRLVPSLRLSPPPLPLTS